MRGDVLCHEGKYRYIYSEDKKYRYWLEAELCKEAEKTGAILFIMLNPGTEEGKEDRNNHVTRTNCERFTREQGFGILWTCNLFAYRARGSQVIKGKPHIGLNNDRYIQKYAHQAEMILCAWGEGRGSVKDKRFRNNRGSCVIQVLKDHGLLSKTYHLGCINSGQPRHPMRLAKEIQPIPYCLFG